METLTFKENKEDILYTLERVNPKYLLALYIKARSLALRITSQLFEYGVYKEGKEDIVAKSIYGADCKEQAYSLARVPVKYDGVEFTVSYKTLHDEVKRRVSIGQFLENTAATTFRNRYSINKEFNNAHSLC